MSDDHNATSPPEPSEEKTAPEFVDMDGPQLVVMLKAYDSEAWDNLLRHYAQDLRQDIIRSLRKRGLEPEHVDDVEQETWKTAVEQINNFTWQGTGKLYNWLRSISYQHVRTLRRKLKDDRVSLEAVDDDIENGLSLDMFLYANGMIEDSPENLVLLRDMMRALDKALDYLKPREREIVMRRLVWRETPRDMAIDYGVKPETISVILSRAKNALRTQLAALDLINQRGNET